MTMTNDRLERDPFREKELAERGCEAEVRWLGPEQRVTITLDLMQYDLLLESMPTRDDVEDAYQTGAEESASEAHEEGEADGMDEAKGKVLEIITSSMTDVDKMRSLCDWIAK